METINFFYEGTNTVDFSIEIEKTDGGILVTSSQLELENEFFNEESAEEFIEANKDSFDLHQEYEIIS